MELRRSELQIHLAAENSICTLVRLLTTRRVVKSNLIGFCTKTPAGVAQLVEQLICNQLVGGSSPFAGSNLEFERLISNWRR